MFEQYVYWPWQHSWEQPLIHSASPRSPEQLLLVGIFRGFSKPLTSWSFCFVHELVIFISHDAYVLFFKS